jgi:hypothetical protein
MSFVQLEHSQVSINTHTSFQCTEAVCAIHRRTAHHMRHFRQFYMFDKKIMTRVCSHEIKHPDPDDPYAMISDFVMDHDCDACCIRFATEEEHYGNND